VAAVFQFLIDRLYCTLPVGSVDREVLGKGGSNHTPWAYSLVWHKHDGRTTQTSIIIIVAAVGFSSAATARLGFDAMKLGTTEAPFSLEWVVEEEEWTERRTLAGQEHPTRGCTVHRVRQLELEARRGATTTNFFSDNNRGGVFSNSTTTIPTRPSSATFPPPTTRVGNSTWDSKSLLLVEVPAWNCAHRVDYMILQ